MSARITARLRRGGQERDVSIGGPSMYCLTHERGAKTWYVRAERIDAKTWAYDFERSEECCGEGQ